MWVRFVCLEAATKSTRCAPRVRTTGRLIAANRSGDSGVECHTVGAADPPGVGDDSTVGAGFTDLFSALCEKHGRTAQAGASPLPSRLRSTVRDGTGIHHCRFPSGLALPSPCARCSLWQSGR